jgi:hypothetical protein
MRRSSDGVKVSRQPKAQLPPVQRQQNARDLSSAVSSKYSKFTDAIRNHPGASPQQSTIWATSIHGILMQSPIGLQSFAKPAQAQIQLGGSESQAAHVQTSVELMDMKTSPMRFAPSPGPVKVPVKQSSKKLWIFLLALIVFLLVGLFAACDFVETGE